jgi:IMP dehydrogenase
MISEALTFNDVLLVPQESNIKSRKTIDLSINLTKNIKLKIPIISSNMDTVTEEHMAIALASNGGIGIIHRFLSIDDQVDMVKRVKRYMSYIINDPYTIHMDATLKDFKNMVISKKVKGFPVVDDDNRLVGIITNRDSLFAGDHDLVKKIMTPFDKLIYAHISNSTTLDEAYAIMRKHKIEKLPLVGDNKKLAGLITIRDILHHRELNNMSTIDKKGRLMVGAAIGVKLPHDIERATALINAGVDVLVVDVAHGHNIMAFDMVKELKNKFPNVDVIAGNVATSEGVKYLIDAGADCVKVGIGLGSICTTRMMTGCGVPQLTALLDCVDEANKHNIPIISDGGNGGVIGNIMKALATGASCVMLGGFLAGTDESPGQVLIRQGKKVKMYRGMSGFGANLSRKQNVENKDDISDVVPEGVDAYVPYKGAVKDVLFQICGGVKSGLSYCGCDKLVDLKGKAKFVKITDAGRKNSNHHSVNLI